MVSGFSETASVGQMQTPECARIVQDTSSVRLSNALRGSHTQIPFRATLTSGDRCFPRFL